ncbi:MAG TPA: aminomethyltransferase family protein [Actinomycetota bacterium]|jgi:aminomethyltransferase|nr:aminomethyltransferase family protein [Actinomycetota bacterium]
MSVGTAFFDRQRALNSKLSWGDWSGYHAAAVFADFVDIEYNAIREAAAVIDVSPLFKYEVAGRDAAMLLDRVVTRDVSALAADQVLYTPWCDEDGKVIDDGTVTRLARDRFRVTAADPSYRWFAMNGSGLDVEIRDVSEATAGLALQGRLSREVLQAATGEDWSELRYFRRRPSSTAGVEIDVTRTGYTGDRGYELWIPRDGALAVWDRLFEVGEAYGIRPAGIQALDIARVEAGLILIEAEYTSARHAFTPELKYSPFEIGLGRLVAFDKAVPFTGRRALRAERAAGGPERRLVGLELDWHGIESMYARHGLAPMISPLVRRDPVPVSRQGVQVGRATSVGWGPTIKKMIGFGSVRRDLSAVGTNLSVEWTVEGERGAVTATVVRLPFLDLERKRT